MHVIDHVLFLMSIIGIGLKSPSFLLRQLCFMIDANKSVLTVVVIEINVK